MKQSYLLIAAVSSSAAPLANVVKLYPVMIDSYCPHYSIVNAGVTGPNLAKFLYSVDKLLPLNLLKLVFRSCNLFRNVSVSNEGRVVQIRAFGQKFTAMAMTL